MLPRLTGASVKPERKEDSKEERGRGLLEGLLGTRTPSAARLGSGEATGPQLPARPRLLFQALLGVGCGVARVTAGSRVTFLLRVYFFSKNIEPGH